MASLRKRLSDRLYLWSQRLAPPAPSPAANRSPEEQAALRAWRDVRGDLLLRLEYPLAPTDQVVDLGGYEGQWASDIHARYRCPVHVFEPMPQFAQLIARRFAQNPAITVLPYGLGARDATVNLSLAGDASSTHRGGDGERVEIREAAQAFAACGFKEIALLKVNIEGEEFELLPHLIATGWMRAIRDVQVQFHSFVPDAAARRTEIRRQLAATHELTYDYTFVWENWRRRAPIT